MIERLPRTTPSPWLFVAAVLVAAPASAASPSFDCEKAKGSVQELICSDAALAGLDREVSRLFKLARDGPHMSDLRLKRLIATQRGWLEGRDDCWKSDDVRACVVDEHVIRIAQLRQRYADARTRDAEGISRGPQVMACEGFEAMVGVTTVASDPPLTYLAWREEQRVLSLVPSDAGARYTDGDETVFWTTDTEAGLDLPDRDTLLCRIEEPS